MIQLRSRRGWLPSLLAAVVLVAGTLALQVLSDRVYDGRARPVGDAASIWDWLGSTYLGLFGPFSQTADGFGDVTALVGYGLVALIVGWALSWRALRALAPGSGALPAWLSMWTAMAVATVLGNLAHWVVADYDVLTGGAAAAPLLDTLAEGCAFGVKWGWVPALLATLVWVLVRPRPDLGDVDNDIVPGLDGLEEQGGAGADGRGGDPADERTAVLRRPERDRPHPDAPYR